MVKVYDHAVKIDYLLDELQSFIGSSQLPEVPYYNETSDIISFFINILRNTVIFSEFD